jgi:HK97 family phage prohead protease
MTGLKRKFAPAALVLDETLGPRQIRIRASTPTPDRAGDVMVPKGCQAKGYAANPIILADHNPTQPIGRATLSVTAEAVDALVDFAPAGISAKADEYCGLAKAGILNAASIGFQPIEFEPIKDGGYRYTKWELMEISLVAVPCNPEALVVGRSLENANVDKSDANWKVGASLTLPVGDDDAWDRAAAEASIFERVGFDGPSTGSGQAKPDSAFARKGFLAYDAERAGERDAYLFPFAKMVDGRLTVVPAALSEAGRLLETADLPAEVVEKARAVLTHYRGKMKAPPKAPVVKDLWDVACLAELLQRLGYMHASAVFEESVEEDNSKLPAMLADALSRLAAAFVAMSAEETRELLEGRGLEVDGDGMALAGASVAKRLAALRVKAGAVLSSENRGHRDEALKCLGSMTKCMKAIEGAHEELRGHVEKAEEHMKALGKKKPAGGDDEAESTDNANGDDPGDNQELSLGTLRRKREVDILRLKAS